jgi:hypothetical protein
MDHLKYSELQTLRFFWLLLTLAAADPAFPRRSSPDCVAPLSLATRERFSVNEGLLFQIAE